MCKKLETEMWLATDTCDCGETCAFLSKIKPTIKRKMDCPIPHGMYMSSKGKFLDKIYLPNTFKVYYENRNIQANKIGNILYNRKPVKVRLVATEINNRNCIFFTKTTNSFSGHEYIIQRICGDGLYDESVPRPMFLELMKNLYKKTFINSFKLNKTYRFIVVLKTNQI